MANELGQPTAQEIAENFCTEMLCNALLCDGCPVQAILHAAQQMRAGDVGTEWVCSNCGTTNMLNVPICQACFYPRA